MWCQKICHCADWYSVNEPMRDMYVYIELLLSLDNNSVHSNLYAGGAYKTGLSVLWPCTRPLAVSSVKCPKNLYYLNCSTIIRMANLSGKVLAQLKSNAQTQYLAICIRHRSSLPAIDAQNLSTATPVQWEDLPGPTSLPGVGSAYVFMRKKRQSTLHQFSVSFHLMLLWHRVFWFLI